jgi:hypothetical protein
MPKYYSMEAIEIEKGREGKSRLKDEMEQKDIRKMECTHLVFMVSQPIPILVGTNCDFLIELILVTIYPNKRHNAHYTTNQSNL